MSTAIEALRAQLHIFSSAPVLPGFTYSGTADYVLDRGETFESRALDEEQRAFVRTLGSHWRLRECFYNGQRLADLHPERLAYYEGYALGGVGFPVHHGWCVLDGAHVVDLTWRTRQGTKQARRVRGEIPEGWAYLGCPFGERAPREHFRRAAKLGVWLSYLDAWVGNEDDASALYRQPRKSPKPRVPSALVEMYERLAEARVTAAREDAR